MAVGLSASAVAQSAQTGARFEAKIEATSAEERLLGSAEEETQRRELLPFTRSFGIGGIVKDGSLLQSAETVGVPPAAMLEAARAFDSAIGSQPHDGDTFYVRWQQSYAVSGEPIGVGRVQWAELKMTSGATFAIHRFKPLEGREAFFLTSGEVAVPPRLALPLDNLVVSSPFGFRGNPFASGAAMGPVPQGIPMPDSTMAHIAAMIAELPGHPRLLGSVGVQVFMHEGVDFAIAQGTPVYAAADGVIEVASPYAGYGNYVRIAHNEHLATAYGHLSRFAPGIKPGTPVVRGQLVAFSGNTGRSTGPHLHFEVLNDGKQVDPLKRATVAQLSGPDLRKFSKLVAAQERERESDAAIY